MNRSLEQLPIRYFDTVDLDVAAFEIARMVQLNAAFDAHYLAPARQENAVLYTAEKRLGLAAATRFPFVRNVMDEN